MDCSTPGLPAHYQLPKFTQTDVHRVGDAIQPSHPLSSPSPAPNPSQHQGLFQWVNSLHEVAKVLEFQLQHQSGGQKHQALFFNVFSKMTRLPDILFYKTFGMLKLLKRSSLGKSTEWHPDYGDQEGLYLKTDKEVSHPFKHFAPHLLWVQIWCINRSNSIWWPIKNILGTSYAIAWAQEYKWSSLFEDSVSDNFPTTKIYL